MKRTRTLDTSSSSCAETDARLRVFSALWALAAIVHLLNNSQVGLEHPAGWLTLLAAVVLITRPASVARLACFAVVQAGEVVWISPFSADHQNLMAMVNVAILIALGLESRRDQPGMPTLPTPARLMPRSIGPARTLLLIAYSAAAFSKYNATFLDPVTSCATFFAEIGSGELFARTGPLAWGFILFAIASETLIATSLIVPRLRRFGVRYGIAFHLVITASPLVAVEDFSFTLDALLMLFATGLDNERLMASAQRGLNSSSLVALVRRFDRPWAAPTILFTGIAATATFAAVIVPLILWWVGLFVGAWLLVVLIRTGRPQRDTEPDRESFSRLHMLIVALMVVIVAGPYLGLRTVGAFTMFSNLRTAGPGDNHYLAPSWDLLGLQDDLISPSTGSSSVFDDLVEDGQAITALEAERLLDEREGSVLIGERGGQPFDSRTDDLASHPLAARLLLFRPVASTGPPQCTN